MHTKYTKWTIGILTVLCVLHAVSNAATVSASSMQRPTLKKMIKEFRDISEESVQSAHKKRRVSRIVSVYKSSYLNQSPSLLDGGQGDSKYIKKFLKSYEEVKGKKVSEIISEGSKEEKYTFYMLLQAVIEASPKQEIFLRKENTSQDKVPTPAGSSAVDVLVDCINRGKHQEEKKSLDELLQEIKGKIKFGNFEKKNQGICSMEYPMLAIFIEGMGFGYSQLQMDITPIREAFQECIDSYENINKQLVRKGLDSFLLQEKKVQKLPRVETIFKAGNGAMTNELTRVLLEHIAGGKSCEVFLRTLNGEKIKEEVKLKEEVKVKEKSEKGLLKTHGKLFLVAFCVLLVLGVFVTLLRGRRGVWQVNHKKVSRRSRRGRKRRSRRKYL